MEIKINKKPKNPKIIEGFPGFGLIGTITTEFLLEHLDVEKIGSFKYEELPATVAIHKGKLVDPMGIFYNKKHNLVIFHTILNSTGLEWKLSEAITNMAEHLDAKEIISLEGVSSPRVKEDYSEDIYFYAKDEKKKKELKKLNIKPLEESIIVGVSAALMLNSKTPQVCFFAETKTELPDSKAAANMVKLLDKYLGLEVDYKPLLKKAEEFEKKFKNIMKQSSITAKERDKKKMSYLG